MEDSIISHGQFYACPIAGLQIEGNSISIGGLLLAKLDYGTWASIEKSHIHLEWHSYYNSINPVFVYHELRDDSDDEIVTEEIDKKITRLISALRLHKYGIVHDPSFTVKILQKGSSTHRKVGPYRDEYLTSILDGYVYNLKEGEIAQVDLIYNSILKLESYEDAGLADNLINSFNLSFLPTMSHRFKLSVLYTALEMLYNVSPKVFKDESTKTSSLYQRAFALINAEYGPLEQTDAWYKFYCESSESVELEIHKIRKIVHHLKVYDAGTNADQAIIYLQESLRMGIRLLGRLYHFKHSPGRNKTFDEKSLNLPPKELLNLALHRLINSDNQLLENILTPSEIENHVK